jgi:hypothetical protein
MTTVTQKTNRVAEAQGLLVDQFKGREFIEAFIAAIVSQNQDLENAAFQVNTETSVDDAVGAQLDVIGSIVDSERGSSNDTDYRLRIRAQIQANRSSGNVEELLAVLTKIGATSIVVTPNYPAKIEIVVGDSFPLGSEAGPLLDLAKKAGVGLDITWYVGASPFTLDSASLGLDQGELVGHSHY